MISTVFLSLSIVSTIVPKISSMISSDYIDEFLRNPPKLLKIVEPVLNQSGNTVQSVFTGDFAAVIDPKGFFLTTFQFPGGASANPPHLWFRGQEFKIESTAVVFKHSLIFAPSIWTIGIGRFDKFGSYELADISRSDTRRQYKIHCRDDREVIATEASMDKCQTGQFQRIQLCLAGGDYSDKILKEIRIGRTVRADYERCVVTTSNDAAIVGFTRKVYLGTKARNMVEELYFLTDIIYNEAVKYEMYEIKRRQE